MQGLCWWSHEQNISEPSCLSVTWDQCNADTITLLNRFVKGSEVGSGCSSTTCSLQRASNSHLQSPFKSLLQIPIWKELTIKNSRVPCLLGMLQPCKSTIILVYPDRWDVCTTGLCHQRTHHWILSLCTYPELQHSGICCTVLYLSKWGISDHSMW